MSSRPLAPWQAIAGIVSGVFIVGAVVHTVTNDSWRRRIRRAYGLAAQALGVAPPRLVFSARAANAYSDGHVVAINLAWARQLLLHQCSSDRCNEQVLIGVLAHELAHHHYNHAHELRRVVDTRWETRTRHRFELEADRAAGAALARLGLGADEFARVLALLSQRGSPTHPMGPARVQAIREGYQGCAWA
jgi:hypothetical protein